jgi:hypothetical protein
LPCLLCRAQQLNTIGIITDLDSIDPNNKNTFVQPTKGKGYVTGNDTLKTWVPEKKNIDELLDIQSSDKVKDYVRVAYQYPVKIKIEGNKEEEAIPYTFEDALVFENLVLFKSIDGNGLINKFNEAVKTKNSATELGQAMFKALKDGKKAEFTLELLYLKEPKELKVPTYINEGLSWLQDQLERKQKGVSLPTTGVQGEQADAK